ncbi:MAG: class I SAM-dependent methyltransferase [Rugosibacter sp.]|nr:class I SAM-dependent methyltransferase [Rugosibacter sp.]
MNNTAAPAGTLPTPVIPAQAGIQAGVASALPLIPGQSRKNVAAFGQVFTPPAIVGRLLALRKNSGRVLDPAAGDGAFSSRIPGCTAIEIDPAHCPPGVRNIDFFSLPESEQFATIIGNPPYVKARDIGSATRRLLHSRLLDGHANLYLHFIEKCVRHLIPGGELIFITPRDFLKTTGAARLNTWLFDQGTLTDFDDLGDARIFAGATPNCAIWRFEKGNLSHRLHDGRRMVLAHGQLMFTRGIYSVPLNRVFFVKVGAVSGADEIFTHDELGNADFVCSRTAQTGALRRMIYRTTEGPLPYLEQFRERLLARRVTKFDESNWWQWGRHHHRSREPRIYVNGRTRNPRPFFLHPCTDYDGAVLALFPHRRLASADFSRLTEMLNNVDWAELGFVCDGRFIFSQRSLEHTLLPEEFAEFAGAEVV